jgi:hypothetical protein
VYSARFSRRLPPRLRRIRWTSPDDAGIGATPASMANAAGDRKPARLSRDEEGGCPVMMRWRRWAVLFGLVLVVVIVMAFTVRIDASFYHFY